MTGQRILIVAGEASSDAHGAGLVRALEGLGLKASFYGIGGPALERAGMRMLGRSEDLAVVGIIEALRVIPQALRLLWRMKRELEQNPPDLFLPIDAPEFNLRLARAAQRNGVPILYFIAPQLWAWRPGRVRILRECVRELLVLFPFEEHWFRERGVPTTHIGHPLVDTSRHHGYPADLRERLGAKGSSPLGLLLPGSRRVEVRRHLPILAEAAAMIQRREPSIRWVLRQADTLEESCYRPHAERAGIQLRSEPLFDLAAVADVAVAVSGTASFETALMGTPTVVVYRVNPLTWWLARRIVRVPWISMANLVSARPILPELLQNDCSPGRIADEVEALLRNAQRRDQMRHDLLKMRAEFGSSGAYERAAARVMAHLRPGESCAQGATAAAAGEGEGR
ncbi:MAG: lipid-A-disaccharide synthase [Candidatus Eisenbacteria sp.]|nr:lipid-A-disaccharide synthase [Candidatus Eisenbacteria bacterium]